MLIIQPQETIPTLQGSSKGEHLDIWAWILYYQGSMCSLCTFNAAPNLYFKYCSDTLLGSPFGKLLVSFVLSFSPLICWLDCHSWFRSLTRLIKPVAQSVFEVISMENVVLYARVLLWWWSERWPPISFFIALLSSVFSLSLCLYWRFAFFPVGLKCLEPAFMVTINKVLCCLIITFFFCNPIVHIICGVRAQSGIDLVLILHTLC